MNKITPFILSILFLGAAGCDVARTSVHAPNSTTKNGDPSDAETAQENYEDATSQLRRQQANADIRAREQRNNWFGDSLERADRDLESEIRSKLEVNLPASELTIDSQEGTVTIVGTVPTPEQLARIEPLAQEIKGVKAVNVKAIVAPAVTDSEESG